MNIRNVREKFKHFGTLSIAQLSAITKEPKEDLRFVVSELLQKGKVELFTVESHCGGGCSCSSTNAASCSEMDQLYRWVQ